jgi:hypothetical protein
MVNRLERLAVLAGLAMLLLLGGCNDSDTPAPAAAEASSDEAVPVLYWLDLWEGSVYRATGPTFSDQERLVHPTDIGPDGIAADGRAGKLYWTNMGDLNGLGGGSLQRANLDGTDVERLVEPGVTHTPKQLQLDLEHGHMYWSDRGTATIWRAALDGTGTAPMVTGHGNEELVGLALDVAAGKIYFGDRATRKILRAGIGMPAGETAADRTDIEELHVFPEGSMPADLDIDRERRHLYWSDRALGTVNRSSLDLPPGQLASTRTDKEVLVSDVFEPIGIALDVARDKLYYAQAGNPLEGVPGLVFEASLDGADPREVGRGNLLTGVTLAQVPRP